MKGLAVGLMSGTSADGVTAVLARFSGRKVELLKMRTTPYSAELRRLALNAKRLTTPELSRLNISLGEAFARAALSVIGREKPEVIGSHGQTVWHGPDDRPANTLQLGEPAVIAERTGIAVAADFRQRDMAAGGQGAPLVPAFDEFLFADGPRRALQNVGGIGNVSIVGGGKLWTAFDTGPGNGLMDLAMRLKTGKAMDRNGELARRGAADQKRIAKMLKHPYFRRKAPKSLDKDDFGEAFLKKHLSGMTLQDQLATLNDFTAASIQLAVAPWKIRELVVAGGGALNPVLMTNLRRRVGVPVVPFSEPMAKEALCFAWLGLRAARGLANSCAKATGARGARILGKIVPA